MIYHMRHAISKRDLINETGICSICGPVKLLSLHKGGRCENKVRQERTNWNNRPNPEYERMLEGQNGLCAICQKHHREFNKKFAFDHDHRCCEKLAGSCGKCIRGLLCVQCNVGVGFFEDNVEYLQRAIEYLSYDRIET